MSGGGFDGVTAITGVGYSEFTRSSGKTVLDLALRACLEAIEDAGLHPHQVDGLISYHENDSALARDVAASLGLPEVRWWSDVLAGGNYPCAAVGEAAMAISSGMARHVVVYRALNGRSGHRMGQFRIDEPEGVRQFMLPYGFGTPVEVFGMLCRRYMHESGSTRQQLSMVAIAQRAFAVSNDRAIRRAPLTTDEYFSARMIAEPLSLYDCCQETDGGCALVISPLELAGDQPHPPVTVAAVVHGAGYMGRYPFEQWPDMTSSSLGSRSEELFGRAGLGRQDIDVAELYDAFTFEVLCQLEEFGFCDRGDGGAYVENQGIGLGSALPINTHGGLLSEGYAQGLNHVCEAVLQLRGACGDRQVPGARTALVTAYGFGSGSAAILVRG
jgi:acetyl-CoA acetyltransferase